MFRLIYTPTVNWYRTREQNHKDDLAIVGHRIEVPVLFIQGIYDATLPPWMSKSMEKSIPSLTRAEVRSAHFLLWHKPEECNTMIKRWIEEVVFGGLNKL